MILNLKVARLLSIVSKDTEIVQHFYKNWKKLKMKRKVMKVKKVKLKLIMKIYLILKIVSNLSSRIAKIMSDTALHNSTP